MSLPRLSLLFSLCGAALFCSPASHAAKPGSSTPDPIIITAQNVLDFGTISDDDGTCTMDSSGLLSGTGSIICFGSGIPGSFSIAGQRNSWVTVSLIPGSSVDGVTFTPQLVENASLRIKSRNITATVVGTLTLNNALKGQKNLYYTLSINYE